MRDFMRRMKLILLLTGMLLAAGCGNEKREQAKEALLSVVQEDQSYAFVELKGQESPVLLVTDLTYATDLAYEEGEEVEAAIYSDLYVLRNGENTRLGSIESLGTAYPIRCDEEGIYESGPHFVKQYGIDEETQELKLLNYAEIFYSETGAESYSYFTEAEGEVTAEDNSFYEELTEKCGQAEIVQYQKKEK